MNFRLSAVCGSPVVFLGHWVCLWVRLGIGICNAMELCSYCISYDKFGIVMAFPVLYP
jgi:hypothetical protein